MARYDDELWELIPEDVGPAPAHLVQFVRGQEPSQRALDVGVGDGRLACELRARELVGIDTSEVALARARTRLPAAELVQVQADERLPFDDGEFDLVLCTETIEHVRDTQFALSEIRRVLRPRGRLAISTPAVSRLRLLLDGPEHPFSPHLRFFTKSSLREVLETMGFEVQRLTTERRTLLAVAAR